MFYFSWFSNKYISDKLGVTNSVLLNTSIVPLYLLYFTLLRNLMCNFNYLYLELCIVTIS